MSHSSEIQLIVGLGNPGSEYAATRHNVGVWFVEMLAEQAHQTLKFENKFHGMTAQINIGAQSCRLLFPTTFMNKSGLSVRSLAQFYQIPAAAIVIVHDELDLAPDTVKLKWDGGHAGHNGLRDIIQHLGTSQFYRLRIGIGHPGDRHKVSDYVLSAPSAVDKTAIEHSLQRAYDVMPLLVQGHIAKAMQNLHRTPA